MLKIKEHCAYIDIYVYVYIYSKIMIEKSDLDFNTN